jgi:hypothetical protein
MPVRSKKQHRKLRVLERDGRIPAGTASRWYHHTPSFRKLPESAPMAKEKQASGTPGPLSMLLKLAETDHLGFYTGRFDRGSL